METDLISKRELLELTGISYGQLYRWKRKNLIPEEWFIRKSAFTGQETFFPREKMLGRIDRIKNMKEDLSLDDLANMFSPSPTEVRLAPRALVDQGIVSKAALDIYMKDEAAVETLGFDMILPVYMLHKVLESGEIGLDEARLLSQTLKEHAARFQGKDYMLFFFRKQGIASCCLVSAPADVYFEAGTKIVSRIAASSCTEELRLKLS
jgi:predicted DNA-binding transcriptional regulator AlpA